MRAIISLLMIVSSLIFGSLCLFAQSQMEMNAVAAADFQKADARLNSVYNKVLSRNASNREFCSDLREAQRAWIRFVDFHMKTLFPLKEGENPREVYGSIFFLEFDTGKTELFNQRIRQLEGFLQDGR